MDHELRTLTEEWLRENFANLHDDPKTVAGIVWWTEQVRKFVMDQERKKHWKQLAASQN